MALRALKALRVLIKNFLSFPFSAFRFPFFLLYLLDYLYNA